MTIARFFVKPEAIQNGQIILSDKGLISQISKVLRLNSGSRVDILDGSGNVYLCVIKSISSNMVVLEITTQEICPGEPRVKVIVGMSLIKSGNFDLCLQKLTELGVATIVPITSQRSIIKVEEGLSRKMERWQSIAREASEQCERGAIPDVVPPKTLVSFAEMVAPYAFKFVCAERSQSCSLRGKLEEICSGSASTSRYGNADTISIAIGPEGGFTPEEISLLESFQFQKVSLGPRILRAETAAMIACAQAVSYFED